MNENELNLGCPECLAGKLDKLQLDTKNFIELRCSKCSFLKTDEGLIVYVSGIPFDHVRLMYVKKINIVAHGQSLSRCKYRSR